MTTSVNIPHLYQTVVDEETNDVLQKVESKAGFIAQAVLSFANHLGFTPPDHRPEYIPREKWQIVKHSMAKSRRVDYNYVVAYHWLKTLAKYRFEPKNRIIGDAIKWHWENG